MTAASFLLLLLLLPCGLTLELQPAVRIIAHDERSARHALFRARSTRLADFKGRGLLKERSMTVEILRRFLSWNSCHDRHCHRYLVPY
jgi:hypothetical protein